MIPPLGLMLENFMNRIGARWRQHKHVPLAIIKEIGDGDWVSHLWSSPCVMTSLGLTIFRYSTRNRSLSAERGGACREGDGQHCSVKERKRAGNIAIAVAVG